MLRVSQAWLGLAARDKEAQARGMNMIHGASSIIQWIGSPSVSSTYGAVKIGKLFDQIFDLHFTSIY